MPDLRTRYLGMTLASPLVASASPLTEDVDRIARLAEAGVGAVVLPSLFEEQLEREARHLDMGLSQGAESFAEALSYFPDLGEYNLGPEKHLELIRQAKAKVDIPIIASLNGVSRGGWVRYARLLEEAGADALELNLYHIPTDPEETAAQLEKRYLDLVQAVVEVVTIPVAVKIHPYFTSLPNMARRFAQAGARGLVLFNRFYQPDVDLENLELAPRLELSTHQELLSRLRWVGILFPIVDLDLAITGGVHTAEDVLKAMMVGARVVMMASALFRNGLDYPRTVLEDMRRWMEEHEYESIQQMQGSLSRERAPDPAAYERANYMKVISRYDWKTLLP